MPSNVSNLVHCCTKFMQDYNELGTPEITPIYCSTLGKCFVYLSFSYFENYLDFFLATSLILWTFLACLAIFFYTFLGWFHQSHAPIFPCEPRILQPWCAKFCTSHIMPYTFQNSLQNHATTPGIFGIMCIFSQPGPPMLMHWTWRIAAPSSGLLRPYWRTRNCAEFIRFAFEKIFCWTFWAGRTILQTFVWKLF